ncbi:DMT family transporter [Sneathiella limimaris]|uniref:DMT family transporter n=1 Tax=Sneathiella limimaris TaxID=1964213 RepID=UPI00146A84DF|nr:DMT family transporter [Sneathiella limimaris]
MSLPHIALALIINVIWGFSFVAAKVAMGQYSPLMFTTLRFILVALLLIPFLKPVAGRMKAIFLISMLVGVMHFTLLYMGLNVAGGVSAVAITIQLVAPFSLILAVVFLGETIRWKRILGLLLAFIGVLILGFDPVVFNYLEGVGLVAGAAMCMAGGIILMRKATGVGTMQMQGWIALFSFPLLLSFSLIFEENHIQQITALHWEPVTALLFTVVATTIIAHGSWYYLLQRYPVSVLTPYGLLAPLFGVGFGVFLFEEPITWRFMVGGGVTLLGVLIINLRNAEKQPKVVQTSTGS